MLHDHPTAADGHRADRGLPEGFAASGLTASKILAAVHPSTVDTSWFGRSLSRPVFLSYQQIEQLDADLERLHATLTGLPERIFGGDMAAFASAVGITKAQADAVLRGTSGVACKMGRADFSLDEQGFRLLEINYGAALGGLDGAKLNQSMAEQPFIGEFIERHRLGYVDPLVEMVHTMFTSAGWPAAAVRWSRWPTGRRASRSLEQSLYKAPR